MTGARTLFKKHDESQKSEVWLGNDKQIIVEGRGTIAIPTSNDDTKLLQDVQYVPSLAHNLLSVGQLIKGGYSILFENDCCNIYDKKKSSHKIVGVQMTQNKMFSLNVSDGDVSSALTVKGSTKADLWHLRYGHLNVKRLQLLGRKNMVVGLLKIEAV